MRFTQVKLAANDPESLASFYVRALDCEILLPLTTLPDQTGLAVGAGDQRVEILVLALPGEAVTATLELIRIGGLETEGNAMLTFYVEDVAASAEKVVEAGGSWAGEIVDIEGPSGNTSRFVFVKDPEGNVIDLMTRV